MLFEVLHVLRLVHILVVDVRALLDVGKELLSLCQDPFVLGRLHKLHQLPPCGGSQVTRVILEEVLGCFEEPVELVRDDALTFCCPDIVLDIEDAEAADCLGLRPHGRSHRRPQQLLVLSSEESYTAHLGGTASWLRRLEGRRGGD